MRWPEKQRHAFIQQRIDAGETINRRDLIEKFGVSIQQASLDINKYRKAHPGVLIYDNSRKIYIRAEECLDAAASDDTKVLDRALAKLRRDQASRVMPVVGALMDFWEMMPNDEKDLVRTNPRLACLLDELEAAVEGDGPFTTDEVE